MIVVLASGTGTNFEAIADAFPNKVKALICNIENAKVIAKAKQRNIPSYVVPHKNFISRNEHEIALLQSIKHLTDIKVIVLAGYMRVLTNIFFNEINKFSFPPLLINLHPAPLHLYKGAHAYEYAVDNKVTNWGLTVHEVIPELDSGKILNFISFPVFPFENTEQLKERVRPLEHQLLIKSIKKIISQENVTL
ncbi:phosphoribosylglycinamide formyltransferase [Silvanigrella aquatica]|uniref:phosphoribosylglycinamide formyltransferase 1 n=1 Tax=Silvanigrella aquatica TaxID=1915309 RepID=A0A1L4CZL8_9BACT|nr:formyltransferase family protein [Silvanigrella aquatica]APJ03391.1 hypothetical protein AXG55_05515 [Silvanigrella aquatica]